MSAYHPAAGRVWTCFPIRLDTLSFVFAVLACAGAQGTDLAQLVRRVLLVQRRQHGSVVLLQGHLATTAPAIPALVISTYIAHR